MISIIRRTILFTQFILLIMLSSCSYITGEPYEDCDYKYKIKFVDDYNMNFADAFANDIKSISFYAFDKKSHKLEYSKTDEGDILKSDGYMMQVVVNPINYLIVAVGNLKNNSSYVLSKSFSDSLYLDRFSTSIKGNPANDGIDSFVRRDNFINPIYHSMNTSAKIKGKYETYYEIRLLKSTNSLNITLQNLSHKNLDKDNFIFSIEDSNCKYDYTFNPLPNDSIKYFSWNKYSSSVSYYKNTNKDMEGIFENVVAELSIGRLITQNKPILTVFNKATNKKIISIPIIDLLLLSKGKEYNYMSDDEYLDRNYKYNIVFYLDENNDWMNVMVLINGWIIRLNDTDI